MTRYNLLLISLAAVSRGLQHATDAALAADQPEVASAMYDCGRVVAGCIGKLVIAKAGTRQAQEVVS